MTFVNLHHHSTYSMLDGYGFPADAAEAGVDMGLPALAQTDHGNLFGAYAFYKACKVAGIKPVIGIEAYVAPDMQVRERVTWGEVWDSSKGKMVPVPGPSSHLTVLARDASGLRGLYDLHARSYLEGFYYDPRLDFEALRDHAEGLIVLSGCVGGELATRLRLGQDREAYELAEKYNSTFEYYIEIMEHGCDFEAELNPKLKKLSKDLKIPLVATGDSHFIYEDEADTHDAILCIGTSGATLADEKRFRFSGSGYWMMDAKEMEEYTSLPKHAIHRSGEIAEAIGAYDEVFSPRDLKLPGDPRELAEKARAGLAKLDLTPLQRLDYEEQLEYELDVIIRMGYSGYCLALEEIVSFAREQGIFVGSGRGSGVGSLVLYSLGITKVDPMKHGLVFERFLNIERKSSPDVDLDFESARRDEVIDFAVRRFGSENVCRILTLGTIATRRAILDSAKVLGRPAEEALEIKRLIPPDRRGRTPTLDEVVGLEEADEEVFRLAQGLDGQLRQPGIHPGGVVVSPVPLKHVLPVKKAPSDPCLMSGFTMGEVEALGLVKLDLLSIKTLDIIKATLESIDETETPS